MHTLGPHSSDPHSLHLMERKKRERTFLSLHTRATLVRWDMPGGVVVVVVCIVVGLHHLLWILVGAMTS